MDVKGHCDEREPPQNLTHIEACNEKKTFIIYFNACRHLYVRAIAYYHW